MKPILFMPIGLPGAGKSTYAKKLAEENNAVILSSDSLRQELYGDMNDQEHNAEVFAELHRRCKELLIKQVNIIYDATSLNQKKRTAFLNELKNIDCYKKAIVFATPYELCLENNLKRDRQVPNEVIKRMRENFHFPLYNEGFDEIEFVWNMGDMKFDVKEMLQKANDFEQHNSHHTLSLGRHMWEAASKLNYYGGSIEDFSLLYAATRLHDIGKFETQTFFDKKGNISEEAHYYQHQYVGAFNAMFYLKQNHFSDKEILHVCTLIQYHMHPYLGWKDSEKARRRDKQLLGEDMFNEVMLLHKCDVEAH